MYLNCLIEIFLVSWSRLILLYTSLLVLLLIPPIFCCSDAQSCPTLCDSMDCCMPDLRVPHHLPKFAEVRDHCIGDPSAIPPSDVLFSFCPKFFPALGTLPRSWLLASAAAAKLLQSCLTLCDPIDGSPPCSAVPGILQARTLEWVAIGEGITLLYT